MKMASFVHFGGAPPPPPLSIGLGGPTSQQLSPLSKAEYVRKLVNAYASEALDVDGVSLTASETKLATIYAEHDYDFGAEEGPVYEINPKVYDLIGRGRLSINESGAVRHNELRAAAILKTLSLFNLDRLGNDSVCGGIVRFAEVFDIEYGEYLQNHRNDEAFGAWWSSEGQAKLNEFAKEEFHEEVLADYESDFEEEDVPAIPPKHPSIAANAPLPAPIVAPDAAELRRRAYQDDDNESNLGQEDSPLAAKLAENARLAAEVEKKKADLEALRIKNERELAIAKAAQDATLAEQQRQLEEIQGKRITNQAQAESGVPESVRIEAAQAAVMRSVLGGEPTREQFAVGKTALAGLSYSELMAVADENSDQHRDARPIIRRRVAKAMQNAVPLASLSLPPPPPSLVPAFAAPHEPAIAAVIGQPAPGPSAHPVVVAAHAAHVASTPVLSGSDYQSEKAKAIAKAQAYWAQHPKSQAIDRRRTAKKVVRKADKYIPNRNDFSGVDTRNPRRPMI